MEQPNHKPGDHVKVRDDDGKWGEAWVIEVIPTYRYAIRRPPCGLYRGTPIRGVFIDEKDIREWKGKS